VQNRYEIANHTYGQGHINFYVYKDKDKIDMMEKELLYGGNINKSSDRGVEPFLSIFRTIIQNLKFLRWQKGMTVV
jgi:hypothetical protein